MSICISWGRQFSAVSHVQKGKRARASSRGHRAQERSASCLHSWNSVSARGLPPNTASCIQRWALSHGGSGDSKDWWLRNTELGTDIKAWYTLQGVEKGLHGKSKRIWFFFLSGLWDQRSCCRWFRCFAFSVMGLLFFPGPDVFTVVSIDWMFEYPLSNSDVEEHSPNVRGLGGVVSGTWLCHEGGAFPPPPEKDTASRGGPLQTPNHFDLGLPASKAVRSTFCCFQVSQFMVLLLSQPRQAETVVLFLCISNGVPPTYIHTHTHTHTHTHPSVPVVQTSNTD